VNKKFTNRLMMRIAGRKGSPIAVMRHTGRRTGNEYAVPVLAGRLQNGFIFALTYGDHVDWYRNILAAGKAGLTWRGHDFYLAFPETILADDGRKAFSQPWRFLLSIMRTADFFQMTIQ
jgi:deazaflavin-dependent oxidoreductase (nitroreductase family)